MDLVYICLGWIFLAVGLIGCFLPVLPGLPIAYLALLAALLILARRLLAARGRPLPPWLLAAAAFGIAAVLSPTAFGLAVWSERIVPIMGAGIAFIIPAAALLHKT